jgi:hypothetical protein
MQERIGVLRHHVGQCLEPFLTNVDVSKVKETVLKEIFSRLEKFDIEGDLVYQFLSNTGLREKYLQAFTEAGIAFVTNNFYIIPDEDEKGNRNSDVICFACGNFQKINVSPVRNPNSRHKFPLRLCKSSQPDRDDW